MRESMDIIFSFPGRITRRRVFLGIGLALALMSLPGCMSIGGGPPIPLAKVDMARMYGRWYLIATIPNGFEKGMVTPCDVFSKRPDGSIREDFYVRRGSLRAQVRHYVAHEWVRPGTNNASWRVQIFWPVNVPFLALYIDPQYRYAMFGERSRKLGWMYSRTPTIPAGEYHRLLGRFEALGYDSSKFEKFVQTPEEFGQPDVWNDGIR